jgi:hypothetical protein
MIGTPRQYLLWSTVAGLFSSAAVVELGVDLYLWYPLMAVNLLLFVWLGAVRVRPGMWALAAVLALSGAVGLAQGSDTARLFAKQFLGILASVFYFSCFFRMAGDDAAACFRAYVRAAYWVAIVGVARMLVSIPFEGELPRLQSVLSEPAMFALTTLPAAFYCLDRYRRERAYGKELAVIGAALLLSRSSVGYLGIVFGLCVFFSRSWTRAAAGVVLAGGVGGALYAASSDFRTRVDDTLRAAQDLTVEDANLSTYALVSNAFVTARVLAEHPVAGNGLGSHLLSHNAMILDVPGVAMFESMILHDKKTMDQLNAADANSLLLRLLSETGIAGVAGVLFFLFRFRSPEPGEARAIHRAVLVYFFAKLLRAGHYFSPEQYFFVFAYCLTGARSAVARVSA